MAIDNEAPIPANQIISDQAQSNEHLESAAINPGHTLSFELECIRPDFCYGTVVVPTQMVDDFYHEDNHCARGNVSQGAWVFLNPIVEKKSW